MEKFTTQDIKDFIKDTVLPKWLKDGKLKKRPISYILSKYKGDKKRTYSYSIKLSELMVEDPMFKEDLELKVNAKTFRCAGYDFSHLWQELLASKEKAQTI